MHHIMAYHNYQQSHLLSEDRMDALFKDMYECAHMCEVCAVSLIWDHDYTWGTPLSLLLEWLLEAVLLHLTAHWPGHTLFTMRRCSTSCFKCQWIYGKWAIAKQNTSREYYFTLHALGHEILILHCIFHKKKQKRKCNLWCQLPTSLLSHEQDHYLKLIICTTLI